MSPYTRLFVLPDLARGLVAAMALIGMVLPLAARLDAMATLAALILLAPLAWWLGGLAELAARTVLSLRPQKTRR